VCDFPDFSLELNTLIIFHVLLFDYMMLTGVHTSVTVDYLLYSGRDVNRDGDEPEVVGSVTGV
jgi:hypothetical protein